MIDATRSCAVEGCEKPVYAKARPLCRPHNSYYIRNGTTDQIIGTIQRFMKFVRVAESGCWEWTGSRMGQGLRYGQFSMKTQGRHTAYAHRVSWELHRGAIPDGLSIDHLCMNTICVNPEHLEPVPQQVNRQRYADSITHCKHGHEFTESNTGIAHNGSRRCRACARDRMRRVRMEKAST